MLAVLKLSSNRLARSSAVLYREVAGIKMSPVRRHTAQQIAVRKLRAALIHPAHEGRNRLSRLVPARHPQPHELQRRVRLVKAHMHLRKARRTQNIIPNDEAEPGPRQGCSEITRSCRTAVRLVHHAQAQRCRLRVFVQKLRCAVRRSIVHHDHFQILEGLALEMFQAQFQGVDAIKGGHDKTGMRRRPDRFVFSAGILRIATTEAAQSEESLRPL